MIPYKCILKIFFFHLNFYTIYFVEKFQHLMINSHIIKNYKFKTKKLYNMDKIYIFVKMICGK